eukprot:Gb_38743 [translate_table: standard]
MAIDIVDFLKNKNVLILGATGFLGKVFLEKILRVQPDVGAIFTLIRANDLQSAQAKLQKEVIFTELFKLLRERYSGHYEEFMAKKIVSVVGDVASENLGIEKSIREQLWAKVDIVVNIAATTTFYERYDVAMNVNTLGAINVVKFCKSCSKLPVLCHVSTGIRNSPYVNIGRTGIIAEKVHRMGERLSINAVSMARWEIESECTLIRKTLNELKSSSDINWVKEKKEKLGMKQLGLQRARNFGWPNVYVFTKAMGEMMVDELREDIPTVIIRPSIIESSLAEPFPGWMQGNRMVDPLFIGYGKGTISTFLADRNLIVDVVPVDMVANAMISSIARHASEPGLFVYHLASSVANTLFYNVGVDAAYNYFLLHPRTTKTGNLIEVKKPYVLETMDSFRRYMTLYYKIPIESLGMVDKLLCGLFRQQYNRLLQKYTFVMNLAELYEPFVFFKGLFDNSNTERLWNELSKEDQKCFNFDVKCIDWKYYFFYVHIPGLMKYVGGSPSSDC